MGVPAKISPAGQIRIPKVIREQLHLEAGDFLDFEVIEGQLVAKPKRLVDINQSWFWSDEWQKGELEANEDIKNGRFEDYGNVDDLLGSLDK